MHILHVTTFLQGGAGRIITSLAIAQREAGQDVTVVADGGGETGYASYPEYIAQLAAARVEFFTITSTFKRDLVLNIQAVKQLRAVVGKRPFDLVHTHAAMATMVARLALGRPSFGPLVQTMHGWGVGKSADQAKTDIVLLGLADAVVTPSAAARETLRALGLGEVPVHVIPYGLEPNEHDQPVDSVDTALFAGLRDAATPVALCIGTFGERKNQALLVRALASLDAVEAVFIGDGDGAPLQMLADEFGLSTRVHVLGYRADASRYLPHAELLVLPSQNEGLPVAVLEALRAGVPVVGSAIPEIAEVVEDGLTGVLFAPGDVEALVAALRRGLDQRTRAAMRRNARDAFDARYGAERMITAYDRLYAELRQRSHAPTTTV